MGTSPVGSRWAAGDFNGDGLIDVSDLATIRSHIGFIRPETVPLAEQDVDTSNLDNLTAQPIVATPLPGPVLVAVSAEPAILPPMDIVATAPVHAPMETTSFETQPLADPVISSESAVDTPSISPPAPPATAPVDAVLASDAPSNDPLQTAQIPTASTPPTVPADDKEQSPVQVHAAPTVGKDSPHAEMSTLPQPSNVATPQAVPSDRAMRRSRAASALSSDVSTMSANFESRSAPSGSPAQAFVDVAVSAPLAEMTPTAAMLAEHVALIIDAPHEPAPTMNKSSTDTVVTSATRYPAVCPVATSEIR